MHRITACHEGRVVSFGPMHAMINEDLVKGGKNVMKKLVSTLAAILALALVLTSCATASTSPAATSGSSAPASAAAGQSAAPTAQAPAYTAKVAWLILTNPPADQQAVTDAINKIALEKINVQVQLDPIPVASWFTQSNLMMSSGEKLDLTIVYNDNGLFSQDVAQGRLLPIDDLLSQYGQGIVKAISDLNPQYLVPGKVAGKTYGVTQLRDLATTQGLCCRKDIADKVGLDTSKLLSVSDLEAVMQKVKEQYPDVVPLVPFDVGGTIGYGLYDVDRLGNGMGVLMNYGKDDTTVVDYYETPEYASLVNKMHDWYQKGYILPDATTNTNNGIALIKSGKAFGLLTDMKPGFANQEARDTGYDMVAVDMNMPHTNTDQVNNFQWCIPTNCKDPVSTMKFLNLMYTDPDIANLLIWGIEGKHYVKTADNPNVITYPDGVDGTNDGWGLNLGWEMGNEFIAYVWKGDSPDLWAQTAKFDKDAIQSKAMGFVFDTSSVKAQVAAVMNVVSQYQPGLEDGSSNPSTELPKFISDLKANGIGDIIKAKQSQLNDYLASGK